MAPECLRRTQLSEVGWQSIPKVSNTHSRNREKKRIILQTYYLLPATLGWSRFASATVFCRQPINSLVYCTDLVDAVLVDVAHGL